MTEARFAFTLQAVKAHKEITLAVIIGLIFGLVVVGGVIRARRAIDTVRNTRPEESIIPSGQKVENPDNNKLLLDITTPDNQVVETPTLTIAGKTNPAGYIVILGEKGEYIVTPASTGTFSQEVNLVKGANTISVTVYLEDGTKTEKELTVVYTTSEI